MIPSWLANVYAILLWIAIPMVSFYIMPESILSIFYAFSQITYICVCFIFTLETLSAIVARLGCNTHVKHEITSIAYIIPAYLDNEAVVLDDTINAFCNLKFNGIIDVMVVYNSKNVSVGIEKHLHDRWDGKVFGKERNITVRIIKNHTSTSKAENVNYGLTLIPPSFEYIAIFDADHQPKPNNAGIAITCMRQNGYDIIQGTCAIRNQDNLLSKIISVEFEDMYCVAHQGRLKMFNLGIFGGSNGYWKADVLKRVKMDGSMLTEDIDSSIRSTLAGYKIGFSSDIISTELAPIKKKTHEKQRLRWSQGWSQVSSKYIKRCVTSDKLSIRQKLGLVYLLGWRETFAYITFWPLFCVLTYIIRNGGIVYNKFIIIVSCVVFAIGILRISATYLLSRGPIGKKGWEFVRFAIISSLYIAYLNYVHITSHGRAIFKLDNWVATVRERKGETTSQIWPKQMSKNLSGDTSENTSGDSTPTSIEEFKV